MTSAPEEGVSASSTPLRQRMSNWLRARLITALTLTFSILAIVLCAALPPAVVEAKYSTGLFRHLGAVLIPATSWTQVSVTGVVTFCLGAALLVSWGAATRRFLREKRTRRPALRPVLLRSFLWGGARLAAAGVILYAVFLIVWGTGYGREPLEERLRLSAAPVKEAELEACARDLLAIVVRETPEVERSGRDVDRAVASIEAAMAKLVERWDGASVRVPSRVKRTPAGWLLAGGTAGVTSPFFLEAHVDGGLPSTAFVSVAAHELAHVAGYCGEAEADVVGVLSALSSADAFCRYSVALHFLIDLVGHLGEDTRRAIFDALPECARLDLQRASDSYRRYRLQWLSRVQRTVYDAYLRRHGVEDGIADYGRAIELYVAIRRGAESTPSEPSQKKLVPAPRGR